MCPAPSGNKFWLQRSSHGRKPKFSSPDDLWSAACEYFEWVQDNPLKEVKAFNCGESGIKKVKLPKLRAMTIQALCFFLDISDETWANYSKSQDFIGVCENIKKVIFSQKFEGVSAGLLSPSIIVKELSMAGNSNPIADELSAAGLRLDNERKQLEIDKLKKELNPPKLSEIGEDYKIPLAPDEEVPSEPIL